MPAASRVVSESHAAAARAPARAAKGNPPPFVVARGEDSVRVFNEVLKHTGFFEHLEEILLKSGKRREMFEIAAKVDFLRASRREDPPVSYVDPRLVAQLFNQLLDRGFRLLRVVEKRNDLSRYLRHRSVKEVGKVLGYDESCYELRDLMDELIPVDFGPAVGRFAAGRAWHGADFRIVIAKNRTHELFGAALLAYNLLATLAVPTELQAIERGIDPSQFVLGSLAAMPVHFGIIEALHSRDGSPGKGGAFELLSDEEGNAPEGPVTLKTDTILAGREILAVEAAGLRMQGIQPEETEFFKIARRSIGYSIPPEIEDLPRYPGWKSLGAQIRDLLDVGKPVDCLRLGLWQDFCEADSRHFPPQPGGWHTVRLREQVEAFLESIRQRRGDSSLATADTNGG